MNSTDNKLSDEAADLIISKMHKGQPFSIKTIDSWIQAAYPQTGSRGSSVLTRLAVGTAKDRGAIVRQDGKYAPGISEGWKLA